MIEIYNTDFRDYARQLADNSIDAIITDPPYPKEFLPLWADMAKVAARVLKPGGWLVSYSGQMYLDVIMQMLSSELTYHWQLTLSHPGANARVWHRKVFNAAKPILVYSKGNEARHKWVTDLIASPASDKTFHGWGQSIKPVVYLVETFTEPNAIVFDPFVGGGTTAIACQQTHRRFIGCEINAQAADIARKRVDSVLYTPSASCQVSLYDALAGYPQFAY